LQELPELRAEFFRPELCELHELEQGVPSRVELRAGGEHEHEPVGWVTGMWQFESGRIRSLDIRLAAPLGPTPPAQGRASLDATRRGGRAVECGGLENR
jgi:hypothetical protein